MEQETERKIWNILGYVIFFGAIIAYITEYLNPHRFHFIMLGLLVFISFRTYVNNKENSKYEAPLMIMLSIILILAYFTWQSIEKDIKKEKVCEAVNEMKNVEVWAISARSEQNMSLMNFIIDANNDFSRYNGTGVLEHNATEILTSDFDDLIDKKHTPLSKEPLGVQWKTKQLVRILDYCQD